MCAQTLTPAQKLALRNDVPALGTVLINAVYAISLWSARARQRKELSRMNHHMLDDIGVTEAMRDTECAKPFWRI
ncbi:MAG: DUF1127 domain-containing protein [Pseudomonadota bacterium]